MHSIRLPFANVNRTSGRRQAEVEALGKTINAERAAAGLSLEALGERAGGIHRNTMVDYEKGRKEVPFGKLVDIAEALGMSTLDLLKLAEERGERDAHNSGARGTRDDASA